MTDKMDVDPKVIPDNTCFRDDGPRMTRARSADAILQEDLIDFREPQQEGFVTDTHEGLATQLPQQAAANKEKMSWPREKLESRRNANEALKNALRLTRKEVEGLESMLESTQRDNEELVRQKYDAVQASLQLKVYLQSMENEKQGHDEKIARLEHEIRTLTRTSDQLRQMLVPVSEKQVLDADVVSKFTSLRMSILGLVRQTWKTTPTEGLDFMQLSGSQQRFFGSDLPLTYERLRHIVSHGICQFILCRQAYFLGGGFAGLEEGVRRVERELYRISTGENRRQITEWRNATFKATESFRDNGQQLSSNTQKAIWAFLSPLHLKSAVAEQNGKKMLKVICDNATELSLMIRQLQDEFSVDEMDGAVGKPISKWSELAEDIASVPAPTGAHSGTIAYVVTGALIKNPKEHFEQFIVLEKAEVAVYA
ncbi:hypothetical protein F5883DRAFT_613741 [Diaporthe sp. PMI_573]|nr:hypothetical protein F5883DRAFT_613741 [Diaporthaceae sp. PMI_573]